MADFDEIPGWSYFENILFARTGEQNIRENRRWWEGISFSIALPLPLYIYDDDHDDHYGSYDDDDEEEEERGGNVVS